MPIMPNNNDRVDQLSGFLGQANYDEVVRLNQEIVGVEMQNESNYNHPIQFNVGEMVYLSGNKAISMENDSSGKLIPRGSIAKVIVGGKFGEILLEFTSNIGGHSGGFTTPIQGKNGHCWWINLGDVGFNSVKRLPESDVIAHSCNICKKVYDDLNGVVFLGTAYFCAGCAKQCERCGALARKFDGTLPAVRLRKVRFVCFSADRRNAESRTQVVCQDCYRQGFERTRCGHKALRGHVTRTRRHGNVCIRCGIEKFSLCENCSSYITKDRLINGRCLRCHLANREHTRHDRPFLESGSFDLLPTKRHFSLELEVEDGDWRVIESIGDEFDWKADLSLDPETGIEFNTPIANGDLGLAFLDVWHKKVIEGAGFKATRRCGLHIHVNVNDYAGEEVNNILRHYAVFEDVFNALVHPDRITRWAAKFPWNYETWSNKQRPMSGNALRSFIDNNLGSSRYFGLNIGAYRRFGSLEFRHHEGTNDLVAIKNWIYLTTKFVEKSVGLPNVIVPPKTFTDKLLMFWMVFDIPLELRKYMMSRIREFNPKILGGGVHCNPKKKKRKKIEDFTKVVPISEFDSYVKERNTLANEAYKGLNFMPNNGWARGDVHALDHDKLEAVYEATGVVKDCPCVTCFSAKDRIKACFKSEERIKSISDTIIAREVAAGNTRGERNMHEYQIGDRAVPSRSSRFISNQILSSYSDYVTFDAAGIDHGTLGSTTVGGTNDESNS